MSCSTSCLRCFLLLCAFTTTSFGALAQRQYYNWYFGVGAGFTFLTSPISALPAGVPTLYQDVCSVSDSVGTLQFVAEGNTVWNRQFRIMAGGQLGGPVVSGYEVMAVPQPSRPGRYYVFTPRHWFVPSPVLQWAPPNLSYFIVDMSQQGGLGEVVARDSAVTVPAIPSPFNTTGGFVSSDIAAVRHANGRDLWLVVKNDQQQYLSYLFDRRGVHAQPVVTRSLGPRLLANHGSGGLIKAAPDGRTLAYSNFTLLLNSRGSLSGQRIFYTEVSRFDASTGRVSGTYIIGDSARYRVPPNSWYGATGGLEFSPDGTRLYADTVLSRVVWQYDLTAGSPAAVGASRTVVARPLSGFKGLSGFASNNLQLGPDGRVYHVSSSARWVSRFEKPNAAGLNAAFRDSVLLFTAGTNAYAGLPHAPNDLGLRPVAITGAGSISGGAICAGETLQFVSSLSPFVTATAYAWDFDDPASGSLNRGIGQAPAHRYQSAGVYTVRLVVTAASGQQFASSQRVEVWPRPVVDLGPDLTLCADEEKLLSPGPQPAGSTYRWHDGSTAASFLARLSGRYRVTVTTANGCTATDELSVVMDDCPRLPNIITPNRDGQNETFVLRGLTAAEWHCRIFNRWGRLVFEAGSYANEWGAADQPAGAYFFELVNIRTGQRLKGPLEVVR